MITEFYRQFKHYLLLSLTICFISGVTLSFLFPSHSLLPLLLAGLCVLLSAMSAFLGFQGTSIILLCSCFLLTGYCHGMRSNADKPAADDVSHHIESPQEAVLTGTLARMVTGNRNEKKIIIASTFLRKKDDDLLIPVSGSVLLKYNGPWPEAITPGDQLVLRATLKRPEPAKSAELFDYANYLADRNIYLTGIIRSPMLIHEIDSPLRPGIAARLSHVTEKTRTAISGFLFSVLPEGHAALYQALLLGDRSSVSPGMLEIFKQTGVMHILAISGLHMALLGFFLFSLFYYLTRLSIRLIHLVDVRKLSLLLCVLPLLAYTLLAGSNTPVLRSFIMSLMFILAFCVNRPKSHLTILAAAALVITLFDPESIRSASYQLSFTAVISIILLTPRLLSLIPFSRQYERGSGPIKYIIYRAFQLAAVTVSATIGTLPLLIYHFNQLSTVTLAANLLVEPLICFWTLPCGFLSIPFMFIYPPLAETFLTAGTWSLDIVSVYLGFLNRLPLSVLWLPDLDMFLITLYYGSLLFALSATTNRIKAISCLSAAVTLALFFLPLTGLNAGFRTSHSVSFIDVGQGSSSLLQLAGGRTIVIDAGATTTPGFDCGEKIIAPYLWTQGIGLIDDIVLTHADADHYNGIPALLKRFRPARLWLPANQSEKPGYRLLVTEALEQGIDVKYPGEGVFITDGYTTLSVIGSGRPAHLGEEMLEIRTTTENNDSGLIISLQTPKFSVLFPGDISSVKEQELIRAESTLHHDILLSPHHGSATSNSFDFLGAVRPQYLVVSAGKRRSGLFPAETTRESADILEIKMLSTVETGTVTVTGSDKGFSVKTSVKQR